MSKTIFTLAALWTTLLCETAPQPVRAVTAQDEAPEAIAQPVIPAKVFNILDYGAVGDGQTMNTGAIKKAVAACQTASGGTVMVPPGRFLTGPFALGSNLNLHLDAGATLLFSNAPQDYQMRRGGYENCLVATGCHDVAITGRGTIDGQGQSWWEQYRKRIVPGQTEPVAPNLPHRPFMVVLSGCRRVLIQDVALQNSPSFHLVPQGCEDVVIEGIHVVAPADSPNTDGLDPSGHNFLITRCVFDVGDDCIALKPSSRGAAARPACENFTITHCEFKHGHGLSIGGQTPGGLRHLVVRDCAFDATAAGIRMKAGRGAGGLVEDLTYENLTMKNVKVAILITSYYPKLPKVPEQDAPQPVAATTPLWRHIRIKNIQAEGGAVAGQIIGLPEMPIQDVVLTDVNISAAKGFEIIHAQGIQFVNSHITARHGEPLTAYDAQVQGFKVASSTHA